MWDRRLTRSPDGLMRSQSPACRMRNMECLSACLCFWVGTRRSQEHLRRKQPCRTSNSMLRSIKN